MKILRQLKDSKRRNMDLYVYLHDDVEFLFKKVKDDIIIEYELLVQKLAGKLQVKTLKFLRGPIINNKKGLLMEYLKDSVLLCHYKYNLNEKQINELQKIILLDMLIGNKDRHTTNIFVNKHLTCFDHDKILKNRTRKSSSFVRLDLGKRLDKDYIEKVEDVIKRNVNTKNALLKYFNFQNKDILRIKSISNKEFSDIINPLSFDKNEKERILNFLVYRRDYFDKLLYA